MQNMLGKNVLVVGGSQGIGLATAQMFARSGARVAITGRNQTNLSAALASLDGQNHIACFSDASNMTDIDTMIDDVVAAFNHIDVLFLNAAYVYPLPIAVTSEDKFDTTVDTCFKGTFFILQKATPHMQPGSSIVMTTSITNVMAAPNFSVYAACKSAMRSITQTAALELSPLGIRINAVSPGPIDTPGFGQWETIPQEIVEEVRKTMIARSPMKRFGTAEEIAKVVLFLSSDDASYINGTELVVDGGMSLVSI